MKITRNVKTVIAVATGLIVVALFFGTDTLRLFTATSDKGRESTATVSDASVLANISVPPEALSEVSPGLKIFDVVVGTGEEVKSGKTVAIHYIGTFSDGTKFDSSLDRNQPFEFLYGKGSVIPGMEQGLAGMRVGGKRHLVISPELAYGHAGIPGPGGTYIIPPDSTLVFDVLLVGVKQ